MDFTKGALKAISENQGSAKLDSYHVPGPYKLEKVFNVPMRRTSKKSKTAEADLAKEKVKFEIYGEEMIEKKVKLSGNSGRVYLPPNWVGHNVKIIRID